MIECKDIAEDESKEKKEILGEKWSDDNESKMLKEILLIRSEESVAEAASKHMEETFNRSTEDVRERTEKAELDRRVRIGEITPFQAAEATTDATRNSNEACNLLGLERYLQRQAELSARRKKFITSKSQPTRKSDRMEICERKKRGKSFLEAKDLSVKDKELHVSVSRKRWLSGEPANQDSDSDYVPSDGELVESETESTKIVPRKKKRRRKDGESDENCIPGDKRILDDGDEATFKRRTERRLSSNSVEEPLTTVDNLFKVPKSVWKKLFKYQRVSVRWLWELHRQSLGGLLGDEMGLGKTVETIAFLVGLDVSELLCDGGRFRGLGPTLIVCPATLLEQWVKHFQDWAPSLRVVVLHHSGTYRGEPECLIESIVKTGGILLTSYSGVLGHEQQLVQSQWHYVILDEGHKIRNPEAKISKAVKRFSTPHRLLLTASPMQNSLKELWSVFDFILPGKLGTLPVFLEHCANPITRGGYANASSLQEATALQVATMLKDAITPYMLRRTKNDVQHHISLPAKNEQVLFCSLTEEQKNLYKEYLRTDHVSSVLNDKNSRFESGGHRARLVVALTTLRKICNHPDLYTYGKSQQNSDDDVDPSEDFIENFGYWKRSGKTAVVKSLLKIWKRQGHRVLLFTQGRQMMHILESLAQRENYTYLRLDGSTPMAQRQQIIQTFNKDTRYFIFISTTRVGGLGVNLTGADRVVIYDPDWNPAIDAQARERAWRIGQDKRVTIYRLITAGTVEEKIYHRQIFKLLLSNRVVEDPRQPRLFQTSDLAQLFNLNEPIDETSSESKRIFRDCKLKPDEPNLFSPRKVEAMRKLASSMSKRIEEIGKKSNAQQSASTEEKSRLRQRLDENRDKKLHRKSDKKIDEPRVSAIFEGEKVSCLIGRRIGCPSSTTDQEMSSTLDDRYVLSKLFAKTNVTSAFHHDAVLSNGKINEARVNPMHRMARDSAQESMDFVRQSRKWCWKPTWDSPKNE